MKPYSFLQVFALYEVPVVAMDISSVFLLSPLAGFMADVKFGRLKVLLCGSFIMLLSVSLTLIVVIVLKLSSYSFNVSGYYMILVALFISYFSYGSGQI